MSAERVNEQAERQASVMESREQIHKIKPGKYSGKKSSDHSKKSEKQKSERNEQLKRTKHTHNNIFEQPGDAGLIFQ